MVGRCLRPLKCLSFGIEGHTVQKIKANLASCGVKFVSDFVPGDVLETRRGGVDVLRHLAHELATLERNGSIKIHRKIPDVGERIGHLLIFDGSLAAAFHRADTERYGIEALLEIESDASALDATMSLHEMSESLYISALSEHPNAGLVDREDGIRDEAWWTSVRTPRRRIEREDRLPDLKPSVSVPEALRRKSEARMRSQGGPVLQRGQAWLEHSIEPHEIFELATTLSEMKQPVLLISRQSPSRIESNYRMPIKQYRWLSETQHARTLEPSLESIRRNIDVFFSEHEQGILFLEGIEYLSGIHGEQRVIEMVRSIVDQTRLNGNVLIVSSNLEAFTLPHRTRLEREFSTLESQQMQTWLLDVDLLQDHPYFRDLDEATEDVITEHLEAHVQDPVLPPKPELQSQVNQIPLPKEHLTVKVDEELQSKMRSWANDNVEEPEEEMDVEAVPAPAEVDVDLASKPRTPQRIIRRRKVTTSSTKRNSIDDAARQIVDLPGLVDDSGQSKSFVPVSAEITHTLPKPKASILQKTMNKAASSKAGKRLANFPPIKSRKTIATTVQKSEEAKQNIQPSPHAREQAASQQRLSDDNQKEDKA